MFVSFGASATALGSLLLSWRYELGVAAGMVVLLFGLHMAGLLPIPFLEREARFQADVKGGRVVGAFLLGLAFAFGWTPCIGPVLGVILTMSASSATSRPVPHCSRSTPRARTAIPAGRAVHRRLLERLRQLSRTGRRLQQAAGILLAVVGVLMITGQLEALAYWLLETFPALGRIG